jgi:hypothetical protein
MITKITADDYAARLEGALAETTCTDDLMRTAMGARIFFLRRMDPATALDAGELQRELLAVRGEMDVLGLYATGGFSNWDGLPLDKEGRQARHGKRGPGAYTPKPSL